jgi:hypothetical protein
MPANEFFPAPLSTISRRGRRLPPFLRHQPSAYSPSQNALILQHISAHIDLILELNMKTKWLILEHINETI